MKIINRSINQGNIPIHELRVVYGEDWECDLDVQVCNHYSLVTATPGGNHGQVS